MASGALVTSSVTLGAASDISRLRFCFSELTAESGLAPYRPASEPWTFKARAPSGRPRSTQLSPAGDPHAEGFARLFELFHASLAEGAPAAGHRRPTRARSLELVTAIYHSAGRTGHAGRAAAARGPPGLPWVVARRRLLSHRRAKRPNTALRQHQGADNHAANRASASRPPRSPSASVRGRTRRQRAPLHLLRRRQRVRGDARAARAVRAAESRTSRSSSTRCPTRRSWRACPCSSPPARAPTSPASPTSAA